MIEHTDPRVSVIWNNGQVAAAVLADKTVFTPMFAIWVDNVYRYTVGMHGQRWATFRPDSEPTYHTVN